MLGFFSLGFVTKLAYVPPKTEHSFISFNSVGFHVGVVFGVHLPLNENVMSAGWDSTMLDVLRIFVRTQLYVRVSSDFHV